MSGGYEIDQPPPPDPKRPARSVLDDSGSEVCPSCGKPLPPGGVVCMECGYDMQEGKRQATWVGKPVEKEPEPEGSKPISRSSGPSKQALVVIGCIVLLCGASLGAWNLTSEAGLFNRGLRFILVVMEAVVHTGIGLAALWMAARLLGREVGKLDRGAARMFLAVSVFLLLINLPIKVEIDWLAWLGILLRVVLAVAGYWVCVQLLFTREMKVTNAIGAFHAGAAMAMYAMTSLGAGVQQFLP